MNEWCINQHGKSGLTAACLSSPHTHDEVERLVTEYIQKWIPEKGAGLLAGSTVHADMRSVKVLSAVLQFPSIIFIPRDVCSGVRFIWKSVLVGAG